MSNNRLGLSWCEMLAAPPRIHPSSIPGYVELACHMSDIAAWPGIDGVDGPTKAAMQTQTGKKERKEKGGEKRKGKEKNSPDSAVRPQNMHVRYWDLDM